MPGLLGKQIGSTGFGLMGLTTRTPPVPVEQAIQTMRAALECGCTFWNAGEHYGTPEWNTQTLLAEYFRRYPEDAQNIVLSVKGAFDFDTMQPDGSLNGIKRSINKILKDLDGTKKIDIFECARVDHKTPLEVTLKYLNDEYVRKGIIGGIGLSEVGAATIHRAAKISRIVSVEVELSLWSTHVLENGVAAACAELHIPIVAYSPIGQGMLAGKFKSLDDLPEGDLRRGYPRFQPENFAINLQLVGQLELLAEEKQCRAPQLALSWIRGLSRRKGVPLIIPIPGATTEARVRENAVEVDLTDEDLSKIDNILSKFTVAGGRYPVGIPTDD
ncbi:NADP-dependent oxidoreductase domain-containing protein [Coniochaeta sp. 2T2.1]|nr:NADP-dependent oxidoreductase domain-containing protein [Coniochaeta sp. 2T2.1]